MVAHEGGREATPPPDPETSRAIAELARRARTALGSSFDRCPPFLLPSFRLWHYPAAGLQVTWVAFQCRVDTPKGILPILRRVTWKRDEDPARLVVRVLRKPSLEPTISEVEAMLDEARLSRFMQEVTKISLPRSGLVHPYVSERQSTFGLEGFDVEGRDGRPAVRVEWEGEGPELRADLQDIVGWSSRAREWFREVLR